MPIKQNSDFGKHFARRQNTGCVVRTLRAITLSLLTGELLASLLFLLAFLGKISLALFELIVWFGQEASSSRRDGEKIWQEKR